MRLSIRKASEALGYKSDYSLRNHIEKGTVTLEPDGTVDVEKARRAIGRDTDPMQRRDPAALSAGHAKAKSKAKGKAKKPPRPSPSREAAADLAPIRPIPDDPEKDDGSKPGQPSLVALQKARLAIKVREEQFDFEVKKKAYLKAAPFIAQVQTLARTFQDQWKAWNDKNHASIAADLEVDPHLCHTVLDKYLRQMFERMASNRLPGDK